MKAHTRLFSLSLIIVLSLAAGCGAKEPESAFLRMLRFIPDKAEYREYVSFGDSAAWHASWDIQRLDNLDELDELDRETRGLWMSVLPSQTWPATALGHQYLLRGEQRDFYGFDLFNLDRWIEAGTPPRTITAVEFGFDGEQIAEALEDSGYDEDGLGGGVLYSILDDYEHSLDFPAMAGRLGALNRIVLLDGQMIIARATELVEDALEANSGERRSLAENRNFLAAATALGNEAMADYGELVGVFLTDDQTLSEPTTYLDLMMQGGMVSAETRDEFMQQFEREADDLPRWEVVAFATQHGGNASYLTLAVVFDEDTDAEEAAEVLADRLEDYALTVQAGQPLMDHCRCSLESATAVQAEGRAVALVTLRAENPPPTPEDERIVNTFVFSWMRLVIMHDTGFLMTD